MTTRSKLLLQIDAHRNEDIILYAAENGAFIRFCEGGGSNLEPEDYDNGYVGYIDYDVFTLNLKDLGFEECLDPIDGGMILLKKDYSDMTPQEILEAVLDMCGIPLSAEVIFIAEYAPVNYKRKCVCKEDGRHRSLEAAQRYVVPEGKRDYAEYVRRTKNVGNGATDHEGWDFIFDFLELYRGPFDPTVPFECVKEPLDRAFVSQVMEAIPTDKGKSEYEHSVAKHGEDDWSIRISDRSGKWMEEFSVRVSDEPEGHEKKARAIIRHISFGRSTYVNVCDTLYDFADAIYGILTRGCLPRQDENNPET